MMNMKSRKCISSMIGGGHQVLKVLIPPIDKELHCKGEMAQVTMMDCWIFRW